MKDSQELFTDFYELTMAQAYLEEGMAAEAVFSLFVRRLPPGRNFLLACGLDAVLDYLEQWRFDDQSLDFLASLNRFSGGFLERLRHLRFTGNVYAVPEGTPVFANEPILEVAAPLPQAQIVETFITNQVNVQTLLASKAWRVLTAVAGRPVFDFGARRMHGLDAALKAARAFYIAGVAATSNVMAGLRYAVPVAGTIAHSYIQAHDDEAEAFALFARQYPETVLLVDTYDAIAGVKKVIALAGQLGDKFKVRAVRLDSGDLLELAKEARALFDRAGLGRMQIFASGELDEEKIAQLVSAGAPIDGFGVGTRMGASSDAPDLDIVYKLTEYAGRGRIKTSPAKPVLPGRKQVFRMQGEGRDVLARADETLPGRPLLNMVMRGGKRLPEGREGLGEMRARAAREVAQLPEQVRTLAAAAPPYPVEISGELARLHEKIERGLKSD